MRMSIIIEDPDFGRAAKLASGIQKCLGSDHRPVARKVRDDRVRAFGDNNLCLAEGKAFPRTDAGSCLGAHRRER